MSGVRGHKIPRSQLPTTVQCMIIINIHCDVGTEHAQYTNSIIHNLVSVPVLYNAQALQWQFLPTVRQSAFIQTGIKNRRGKKKGKPSVICKHRQIIYIHYKYNFFLESHQQEYTEQIKIAFIPGVRYSMLSRKVRNMTETKSIWKRGADWKGCSSIATAVQRRDPHFTKDYSYCEWEFCKLVNPPPPLIYLARGKGKTRSRMHWVASSVILFGDNFTQFQMADVV